MSIQHWAADCIDAATAAVAASAARHTASVTPRLDRVLAAFQAERVGVQHFASVSGYGHGDQGREVLDRVFARVLQAEAAAVRLQFVSGTHAIAAALYGVLRPGDRLLALTGRPYDTLEEVIGVRGSGQGSLVEFGIRYDELSLLPDGGIDWDGIPHALATTTRMVLIQRSCGYSWRPSLSIEQIGREGGTSFDLNRLLFQGLFLAPQMVAEALIGAELVASTFSRLGFPVKPLPGGERSDVIQAVQLGSATLLKAVCRAFQAASPIGSYLDPVPAPMPGYASDLVMAGGTFIDGSTSEFSADGPLRDPFVLFVQGGSHHAHLRIALRQALVALAEASLVEWR
jgi:cystathionine beta-lyase family protein involved in aluminum resistance